METVQQERFYTTIAPNPSHSPTVKIGRVFRNVRSPHPPNLRSHKFLNQSKSNTCFSLKIKSETIVLLPKARCLKDYKTGSCPIPPRSIQNKAFYEGCKYTYRNAFQRKLMIISLYVLLHFVCVKLDFPCPPPPPLTLPTQICPPTIEAEIFTYSHPLQNLT